MRRRGLIPLVLVLALTVAALGGVAIAQPSGDASDVYVVHAIPGVDVDVYVDYADDPTLEGFAFEDVAGPLSLPEGTYTIEVFAANADPDTDDPVIEQDVDVPSGETVALVAQWLGDGSGPGTPVLTPFLLDTSPVAPDAARVSVHHAANAPNVDVLVEDGVAFANVASGQAGATDVPGGTYNVKLNAAGTDTTVFEADVPFAAGALNLAVAAGNLTGGGDDDFTVFLASIELQVAERTTARLAGPTRFETAIEVAREQFPQGADRVYLATGLNFPDALVAGTLTDGPVLLVGGCTLPSTVRDYIAEVDPSEIVAVGGSQAICDAVLEAARDA